MELNNSAYCTRFEVLTGSYWGQRSSEMLHYYWMSGSQHLEGGKKIVPSRYQEPLTQWHSITSQKTSVPSNNTAINLHLTLPVDSVMSITHHKNGKFKNKHCIDTLWFRQLFVALLYVETYMREKDCKRPHMVSSPYIHLHIRKWQPSCIIIQATASVQIKYFHNNTSFWPKYPLIFLPNYFQTTSFQYTHTHTHTHTLTPICTDIYMLDQQSKLWQIFRWCRI